MSAEVAMLGRLLARTKWRMRAQRALDFASAALLGCAGLAGLQLAFVGRLSGALAAVSVGLVLLASGLGLAWPVASVRAAAALDRQGALAGRMLAAWEFAALPAGARGSFAEAALRDAALHAHAASPRGAAPLRAPRLLAPALLALALLLAFARLSPHRGPTPEALAPAPADAPTSAPRSLLPRDDLDAFEANRRALLARLGDDPELEQAVEKYRELLSAIGRGSIARETAVSRLLELSAVVGMEDDEGELELAVRAALGERALGRAKEERDEGEGALASWSRALSAGDVDARERARLEAALARARAELGGNERDAGSEESLLRKKGAPGASASEPKLLADKQRELERLRREHEQQRSARRELERLRRELERAARATREGNDAEARDALDGAEQARQRIENRADLARELEQLREQLQRQSEARERRESAARSDANGEERTEQRRERFRLRAHGEEGDGGTRLALGRVSDAGASADGGSVPSESQGGAALELSERAGASEITIESERERESAASSPGDQHASERGPASERARARYEERQLEGAKGAGPTRSEVIGGAAKRGFASAPYRKVYADYRAHAETLLERDDVPPGYRFYVRRYFQLVRPRAGEELP